jgi:succinylarginine dihydrolase
MPRQTLEASQAVAEQHQLGDAAHFLQQHVDAIAAGVFHNDVICVGNESMLLLHERAWHDVMPESFDVTRFVLTEAELPLEDAVRSYLFNSQLVTLPTGEMALIYPAECDEVPTAKAAIERILREDNPVTRAVRVDVRQSMKNGGGPACLRLRVVLSDEERSAVRGNVFWTPQLHETLVGWVNRHYRDHLTPADLADVRLYHESEAALDELREILDLPVI